MEENSELDWIKNQEQYVYVIRRVNSIAMYRDGRRVSDIIGITLDEDYAKSKQSVFVMYEKVKVLNNGE